MMNTTSMTDTTPEASPRILTAAERAAKLEAANTLQLEAQNSVAAEIAAKRNAEITAHKERERATREAYQSELAAITRAPMPTDLVTLGPDELEEEIASLLRRAVAKTEDLSCLQSIVSKPETNHCADLRLIAAAIRCDSHGAPDSERANLGRACRRIGGVRAFCQKTGADYDAVMRDAGPYLTPPDPHLIIALRNARQWASNQLNGYPRPAAPVAPAKPSPMAALETLTRGS